MVFGISFHRSGHITREPLIHIAVLKCLLLLFRNIRSIDVSDVVIRQMKEQNKGRPGLVFEKMDAMNMDYQVGYQT